MKATVSIPRWVASSLGALALMGASVVAVPSAQLPQALADASATITSGQLQWGFKESFRNYLTGPVAQGSLQATQGATYDDDKGTFIFPAVEGVAVGSDSVTAQFKGGMEFSGHAGILDTKVSDIRMRIEGNSTKATLIADVVSREFKGMTHDAIGDSVSYDDIEIADVQLSNQADLKSSVIDLSGKATLTEAGAPAFGGFYDAGAELDDTVGKLALNGTDAGLTDIVPGGGVDSGSSGSSDLSSSSDDSGAGDSDNSGDTGNTDNSGNTGNTDNSVSTGNSKPSTGGGTTNNNGGGASYNGGNSGTPGNSGTGGASSGSTSNPGGSSVCSANGSVGVSSSQALWGVKSSFRTYITGNIAKGKWDLSGVGYQDGNFVFQGSNGAVNADSKSGTMIYPGSVRFTGHGGVMDLTISNLELRFSGSSGQMIANVKSNDMDGNSTDFGRTQIATLGFNSLNVSSSKAAGKARATLTESGAQAFAGFYQAGTELDPISFTASLGGDPNCTSEQMQDASSAGVSGRNDGGMAAAESKMKSGSSSRGANSVGENSAAELAENNLGNSSSDEETLADQASKFRIKNADASNRGSGGAFGIVLILASIAVAGGSMTRFGTSNPAGKSN